MAAATTPTHDGKMRAIVQRAYGTAEVLHPDRIDRPRVGPNEVLVEVRAAGLDRGAWHLMTGGIDDGWNNTSCNCSTGRPVSRPRAMPATSSTQPSAGPASTMSLVSG